MEHEETKLDNVDDDEDELVGLRADCDAASCPDAPRPCAPPRRRLGSERGGKGRG